MRFRYFILVLASVLSVCVNAQTSQSYKDYIEKYKHIVVKQNQENNIPASIIMAQGLLESGAGMSELSVKANNHFGIKCTSDWKGDSYRKDDDKKDECFRKYKSVEDSFRDHSEFLKRSRYSSLYSIPATDYKSWAHGLKAAGYATDPQYAYKLIRLIENYSLHEFDVSGQQVITPSDSNIQAQGAPVADPNLVYSHPNKNMRYVIAQQGENISDIALRTKVKVEDLLVYNELRYDQNPIPGQYVFLTHKQTKGADKTYTVKQGDTMYLISQALGIKVEYLYTRNNIAPAKEAPVGTQLYLRTKNRAAFR